MTEHERTAHSRHHAMVWQLYLRTVSGTRTAGGAVEHDSWTISSVLLVAGLTVRKERIPLIRRWRVLVVLGFFRMFAFSTLTNLGLGQISASQAGMISAGSPITILAFTPWLLHQRVRAATWIGAGVAVRVVIVLLLGKRAVARHPSWSAMQRFS